VVRKPTLQVSKARQDSPRKMGFGPLVDRL
jgi:hypothetical protein